MKLISFDGMYENMKESSGSASKPFLILSASDLLPALKGARDPFQRAHRSPHRFRITSLI
jgi:hypothetical protein